MGGIGARGALCAALALGLGGALPAARGQEAGQDAARAVAPRGPACLDHPGAARGDAEAGLEAVLAALTAAPGDGEAPLLLAEAKGLSALVPGGRARLVAALERALAHPRATPAADDLLAALADARRADGAFDEATALQARRGFLGAFLVCGPFGVNAGAALPDELPPEVAAGGEVVDPEVELPALRERRRWVPLEVAPPDVALALGRALSGFGAVSFALTHVEVPAALAGPAYLVYTGPSANVWLNRVQVAAIDREAERLDGELRLPVELRAGWNRLLLELAGGAGARCTLRLTDAAGAPLAVRATAEVQPVPVGAGRLEPPLASFGLTALARDPRPARAAAYAWALAGTGRGEEAWVLLEDLARRAPELERAAWLWVLRGDLAQRADHLPAAARRDQARQAYARAVALDPGHVRARRRQAELLLQDDKAREGVLLLEAILAERPRDLETRLRLVQALLAKGWLLEAEEALLACEAQAPGLPAVLEQRARLLSRRGMDDEAHAAAEELLLADRAAGWVLARRLERAVARGDRAGALGALDGLALLGVPPEDLLARRAAALRGLGDGAGEVAALRARALARPWDAAAQVALATRLLEEPAAGREARAEAERLLAGVVAAEPGRRDALALLEGLRGEEDRFWAEWAPDPRAVIRGAPAASHWPKAATVCLFDQMVTKVRADGSSTDVVHQLFLLLDESGKERYGSRPKSGELLVVRTHLPSGEVLEPIQAAGGTFEMPGLAPGVVVEHAYRVERGAAQFQLENGPFYFQDPELTEPYWLSRWVIWVHEDAPVDLLTRNLARPGITVTTERRGPWRVHVLEARDQPRFEVEPFAPDNEELLPWARLLERRSHAEVGQVYRGQLTGAAVVTPTVARAAEVVCEGAADDQERARRLVRFVQDHVTRGEGGGSAAQTLAARAGSKTRLLLALLAAADVPHRVLLAGPRPDAGGTVEWHHPEPGQFRLPLVRIEPRGAPAWDVFVEGHRLAALDRLPAEFSGAPAFDCGPGGFGLETLPQGDLWADAPRTRTHVALGAGGHAVVRVERALPAFGLARVKEAFASAPEVQLRGFFARQANAQFPGANVRESAGVDLDVPGAPFAFWFVADVARAARPRGDGRLELAGHLAPSDLRQGLATHTERRFDLVVQEPYGSRDEVTLDLGPYACPELPPPVLLAMGPCTFSLVHRREGPGRIRIERAVLLRPGRVRPADYPAFRALLGAIDEAERRPLPLVAR